MVVGLASYCLVTQVAGPDRVSIRSIEHLVPMVVMELNLANTNPTRIVQLPNLRVCQNPCAGFVSFSFSRISSESSKSMCHVSPKKAAWGKGLERSSEEPVEAPIRFWCLISTPLYCFIVFIQPSPQSLFACRDFGFLSHFTSKSRIGVLARSCLSVGMCCSLEKREDSSNCFGY